MNLPHTLQGVGLLGIDSAPLIYLVEKHPTYFDAMVFILRTINSGSMTAVSSILSLTEVLTQPLRVGNEILVREYEDILQNSVGFELLPLNAAIARKAADLRAHYNLKTPDAIQVATCINAGCEAFLTNDLRLKRMTEIQMLVLDELELDPPKMNP